MKRRNRINARKEIFDQCLLLFTHNYLLCNLIIHIKSYNKHSSSIVGQYVFLIR